jgi:hypothetical protein
MKQLSLALLALATALAIAPAALADTIAAGSSFTVSGNIPNLLSSTPTLTHVEVSAGSGTFADINDSFLTSAQVSSDISLNSSVVGDTFTVPVGDVSDGKTITFTVGTVNFGANNSASGLGTITDTGFTTITNAYWSESINSAGNISFTFDTTAPTVPEPSSLVLFGTGLLGLAFVAFRKAKSSRVALSMSAV